MEEDKDSLDMVAADHELLASTVEEHIDGSDGIIVVHGLPQPLQAPKLVREKRCIGDSAGSSVFEGRGRRRWW